MKKLTFTIGFLFCFLILKADRELISLTCDVGIEVDTSTSNNTLIADALGVAPFTYSWSTGQSTQSIIPNGFGTYCVTMTDNTGCTSDQCITFSSTSCSTTIGYEVNNMEIYLIGNSSGVEPFTYNWSTGETTLTISPTSSGTYAVTITDAIGCVDTSAYYLSCQWLDLSIDYDSTVVGNTTFTVEVWNGGYAPFTYLWSTGETTQSIIGNTNNEYTVTVTDAIGCTSFISNYYCGVYIDGDFNGATGTLTAIAWGSSSLSYLWSTGEMTPTITYNTEGLYCVTVTDALGCSSVQCINVNYNNDMQGQIILDSLNQSSTDTFYQARVYLIQYDSIAGTLQAIDSVDASTTINSGPLSYSFPDVPNGDYLVKAALLPGSGQYENFLPTYHQSALFWNEATNIEIPFSFAPYVHIHMIAGNNPGGFGFIGGLVSEGANFTASGQVETRGEGDPVSNVNILLLTENDEPVTHTLTDANGAFEFPNIAWGTYKVIVEMLGKDPGEKMVTIGPNTPSISIDFSVNETYITNVEDVLTGKSIKVFPNPVEDLVNVQLELEENIALDISVINLLGNVIISENKNLNQGVNTLTINIKDLPAGIYFLNLKDDRNMISKRIIKN